MDDLREDNIDELENTDALLDDSIFEEIDLDVLEEEDHIKALSTDDDTDTEDEKEEDEEILDELDALAAEEDEEEFDFYGDEEDF